MKQHDRSAADNQDEKPGRAVRATRLERIQKHMRREIRKVLWEQPRKGDEFPDRLQQLIISQQGG